MKKEHFQRLLEKPLLLDGAAGTYLMEKGLPFGVCPESWAADHTDLLIEMHREYRDAGAQLLYAFTFGANHLKLTEYGEQSRMEELNTRLVQAALTAADGRIPVAGNLSQTGQLVAPFGPLAFDRAVEAYAAQARALERAGADLLVIETMMDLQEARAAVIGCKEATSLPVVCTLTFDESGRTLTGSDGAICAVVLTELGVDALGANCGTGPLGMAPVIRQMAGHTHLPIFAKPNAGIPGTDLAPNTGCATDTLALLQEGASAVGGCCGTTPENIRQMAKRLGSFPKFSGEAKKESHITSISRMATLGKEYPFLVVGERINPTGKKRLQQALLQQDIDYVVTMGLEQGESGAHALDVNVGMHGVSESALFPTVIKELSGRTDLPLFLDTTNISALEQALRIYPGRAVINSISAEEARMTALFPLAKKYGAMYIALPISDTGIPASYEERIANIQRILACAQTYQLSRQDVLVDVLALTLASDPNGGRDALRVIDFCAEQGLSTMMGVSNISFGLPLRSQINHTMLTAAIARGMTAGILNPTDGATQGILLAVNAVIKGEDGPGIYSAHFTPKEEKGDTLFDVIVLGDGGRAKTLVERYLKEGKEPSSLIEETIIPALDQVGKRFSEKTLFLPQLMASADAAKVVFDVLSPLLTTEGNDTHESPILLATVEGDIHDIGKNIVGLMLQNNGFPILDLGRDVKKERILTEAMKSGVKLVGLSALLTTTMERMAATIHYLRDNGYRGKVMVGGAVVSEEFAQTHGVHYGKDAAQAVSLAKELLR